jgi:hypothetical protein
MASLGGIGIALLALAVGAAGCGTDDDRPSARRIRAVALETGEPIGGPIIIDGELLTLDGVVEVELPPGSVTILAGGGGGVGYGAFVGEVADEMVVPVAQTGFREARVEGTVGGWTEQPAPPPGHTLAVWIDPSLRVIELLLGGTAPAHAGALACATRDPAAAPCSFALNLRAETTAVVATIVEVAGADTTSTDDDRVVRVRGFATALELALDFAVPSTDVVLEPTGSFPVTASLPDPGGEVSEVIGVPGIAVGSQVLVFRTMDVPEIAEMRRWLIVEGIAGEGSASMSLVRDVMGSEPPAVDSFPIAPPALAIADGTIEVGDAPGPVLLVARNGEDVLWTAWLTGGMSFEPGELGLDSTGGHEVRAVAFPMGTTPDTVLAANAIGRSVALVP